MYHHRTHFHRRHHRPCRLQHLILDPPRARTLTRGDSSVTHVAYITCGDSSVTQVTYGTPAATRAAAPDRRGRSRRGQVHRAARCRPRGCRSSRGLLKGTGQAGLTVAPPRLGWGKAAAGGISRAFHLVISRHASGRNCAISSASQYFALHVPWVVPGHGDQMRFVCDGARCSVGKVSNRLRYPS